MIKEVNSSSPRLRDAIINQTAEELCPPDDDNCIAGEAAKILIDVTENSDEFLGEYEIPSQNTIDLIVEQMYEENETMEEKKPSTGLDKLARDTEGD